MPPQEPIAGTTDFPVLSILVFARNSFRNGLTQITLRATLDSNRSNIIKIRFDNPFLVSKLVPCAKMITFRFVSKPHNVAINFPLSACPTTASILFFLIYWQIFINAVMSFFKETILERESG